jgi:hypothetical protein
VPPPNEISTILPTAEQNGPLTPPTTSLPPIENISPPHSPISAQWQNEWQHSQSEVERNLNMLQTTNGPKVEILRVNQLDAIKLDQEINEVLKMQFMKIFSFMKVFFLFFFFCFILLTVTARFCG